MQGCCSGEQGSMVGPCSCGMFHGQSQNSFSMLFPFDEAATAAAMSYDYPFAAAPSSSVDCTLSLGTPSTRLGGDGGVSDQRRQERRRSRSSYMSNFCWDMFQTSNNQSAQHKSGRGGAAPQANAGGGNDPLLARRCANCDTTSTPLWRNGPRGPKSLCNACGIRFKKEERRAAATANSGSAAGGTAEQSYMMSHHNGGSWGHQYSQAPKAMANEFRFIDDEDRDSDNGLPFLSWRLNVADRASLVNDFTRY